MFREFYSALPSTLLPLVVMVFFVVVFGVILLRTFALRRRHDYDRVAALPLADAPAGDRADPSASNPPPPQENASEVN